MRKTYDTKTRFVFAFASRSALATKPDRHGPMTRSRTGEGNAAPTAMNATYYAQRASAGLIITEATQVSWEGVGYPNTPGIHTNKGARQVMDTVGEVKKRRVRGVSVSAINRFRAFWAALYPGACLPNALLSL